MGRSQPHISAMVKRDPRMAGAAPNVSVVCQGCQSEIPFVKAERLPEVISLVCPTCGRRKIYSSHDVVSFRPEKKLGMTGAKGN